MVHKLLFPMVLISAISSALFADSMLFPTPKNLTHNVSFWKKIYCEVKLDEGLLHDSEYPLVIYKKIKVGKRTGRSRTTFIKNEKDQIITLLHRIDNEPRSSWSKEMIRVDSLFKSIGDKNAFQGSSNRIRFQQGQAERFKKGVFRSGAYLDTIRSILSSYGVPSELAFLPHVESSFNPNAYSKVGAAGLWQFMRGTGKQYLTINYHIDERRDPILSTFAAAKLLSYNYSVLKSWPLAITAYNHGLYGMKRAVAKTGSDDIGVIIEKHSSRSFRFASKNFYSCFLAALEVASNPEKYIQSVTYAPRLRRTDITLQYHISAQVLVDALGIDFVTFKKSNPAIRSAIYNSSRPIMKGTTIYLPYDVKEPALKIASIPDSLKLKELPRPKFYRVRRGDNLYAIARRYNISATELALANNITRMNRIYAGQVLELPPTAGKISATRIASVLQKEPKVTQKTLSSSQQNVAITTPTPKELPDSSTGREEIVLTDTSALAQKMTPTDTLIVDSLRDVLLATADTLPDVVSSRRSRFDASVYTLDVEKSDRKNTAAIRVSVNETIGHYADWLQIPTYRIRSLNRMGRGSHIRMGQKLQIPGTEDEIAAFSQRRLEYHMAIEEDFYALYKVEELQKKVIQRGETLWDISDGDNQIPIWLIIKYNTNINFSYLFPGVTIWMPVVVEKTDEDIALEKKRWGGQYPAWYMPGVSGFGALNIMP